MKPETDETRGREGAKAKGDTARIDGSEGVLSEEEDDGRTSVSVGPIAIDEGSILRPVGSFSAIVPSGTVRFLDDSFSAEGAHTNTFVGRR